MTKKNKDLNIDYTTNEILKRVFTYALKSKWTLIFSVLLLIIFTSLQMIQPLITKKVIDDELSGVQTIWEETTDTTKAFYNDKYYVKSDGVGDNLITIKYSEENEGYILIENGYDNNYQIKTIEGNNVVLVSEDGDEQTSTFIFLGDDITIFYDLSSKPILRWILIYAIISIIVITTRYIQNISFTFASMKLTLDIRKSTFDKLNRLPVSYFSKEPSGKTVTKMIYDSEGVRGLYNVIFSIFSAIISLVIVYVGLFALDYKLALLTFASFPIVLLWLTVYRKIVNKFNKKIRETNSRINGKLAEFVNSVGVIQIFNKEEKMSNEYDFMLKGNYGTKMKQLRVNTFFGNQMLLFIERIIIMFVLFYFGLKYFSLPSLLIATTISVYIDYIQRLVYPISEIFGNLNSLEDSLVSASRVFDFLDSKEDIGLDSISGVKLSGNIEFKNVYFQYEHDNYVLHDINFKVKSGQFVGLVGHTGSGKTTLMNLLERYYDLDEGNIFVDGVDYNTYSKYDIRENIGIILQDASIFEGTIKSNVAFGIEATDEEVIEVLRSIGADKFIYDYPEGIHSKINYSGENLSTGEKQLISFARILLKNPSILILDEATANIDTETEVLIQKSLKMLAKDRTTFVVAHRLSTIKDADVIYLFEDGRIFEQGTHEELYKKKGKYRAMYDAQYHK
ncbi:MAG: ABC transporter ATP-binding protein [Bacilli bacterium]|jgi:ATP-binding cassette subfamily B protein|nr:ABC transporter ATP-binding protein [Bacilli bacterium]MDD3121862.1 ABC transporter ATP-binding protein [Bacilli bacterium]MDD4063847.1 ABC transporter ATP-binding protein [Bacilli bacterium]MDD4482699.1 ABC transporter ATP-binding protein [Bacilli bacterium]MDY0364142.1 ABC transporter ATP-binding protein [Bacilli bacterium]